MYYKKHYVDGGACIVGICDSNLIGMTIADANASITISGDFFLGTSASDEEIVSLLTNEDNITLVGNHCVTLAIENGFVDESSCIRIHNELYAQIMRY
ncbi:MAG: DUF424 domain-containing protein [Methanospirillaceae archaeon]|nr:DUF424 domain-containing protein [Methanospirillaceae archaeon]